MTDPNLAPASPPSAADKWTIRACLRWTTEFFTTKEIPNPRVDAEELLAHAYGVARLQLLMRMEEEVPTAVRAQYREFVQRRAKREPLQHILGCVDFFGLRLETTPGVLIPRPETEGLVEHAVTFLRQLRPVPKPEVVLPVSATAAAAASTSPLKPIASASPPIRAELPAGSAKDPKGPAGGGKDTKSPSSILSPPSLLRVWDIGTGSGCIAIAIARMHPQTAVLATDIAPAALELARRNAVRNGLTGRIDFRRADLSAGLNFTAPFDLIVSNPPYLPEGLRAGIQPEVAHDPPTALYSGADGLDLVRRILALVHRHLAPEGRLMLEIGLDQGAAICAEATQAGFRNPIVAKDIFGRDRYFLATAPTAATPPAV